MPCGAPSKGQRSPSPGEAAPYSRLRGSLIERNYRAIGCDQWDSRKVKLLCAKLGETPEVLGARLRLRPAEITRRMEADSWTRQDGLILTIIDREIELLRGGVVPSNIILRTEPSTTTPT